MPEEQQPYHNEHRQHEGQRVFYDVAEKGGCVDFLVVGDGFDHEVRAVADVGVRPEKDRADAHGEEPRRTGR